MQPKFILFRTEYALSKSRIQTLFIALVTGCFLTACGGDDPEENQNQNQNQHEHDAGNDTGDADGDSDTGDGDADTGENGDPHPYPDCSASASASGDAQDDYDAVQGLLLEAQEGDIICFFDGDYSFEQQLSLQISNVELRGESRDGTRFDFSDQDAGASGIDVQDVENFQIRSLSILNTGGDGLVVRNTDGVTIDDIAVIWEGNPSDSNGAYGIYPVTSSNVIVENSVVRGASDAGIYLGQSEYGILRNNEVYENVAGIEVENSTYVDVHDNDVHENTGGILIFNLPELQRKEGDKVRVFDNQVYDNNYFNFTSGGIVQLVPSGTGILIVAVQEVEVFGNTIEDHDSLGIAVVSYQSIPRDYEDDEYYPFAEAINIHSNTIINAGENPVDLAAGATETRPVPDILWDGIFNPEKDADEIRSCFSGNVDGDENPVTFENLRAYDEELGSTDELGENDCDRDPLDPVVFE